ncbi:hypothetical protein HS088_TW07G00141 [Tripterygium wilfordii]|uniref:Uncharacterized protein n=1 Tax=Tripterygium wilfordii TaxID=458696 RepID=A0A7J7DDX9_TRIWF|nr:hypothetical protein HS088_TW07G00141 [Tripterygium wilfordii]
MSPSSSGQPTNLSLCLSFRHIDKHMEGLIPFIYKVIVQYRAAGQSTMESSWFDGLQNAPYARLPGDSGRFSPSMYQLSAVAHSTTSHVLATTGIKSPIRPPPTTRYQLSS